MYVVKTSDGKFGTGSKFATAIAKHYGGGKGEETVQIVRDYGSSKVPWLDCGSISSAEALWVWHGGATCMTLTSLLILIFRP